MRSDSGVDHHPGGSAVAPAVRVSRTIRAAKVPKSGRRLESPGFIAGG
jgi:hypothetical protein